MTLYNIGVCYSYDKQNEEAVKFLEESLKIRKSNLPKNDPSIAQTLKALENLKNNQPI